MAVGQRDRHADGVDQRARGTLKIVVAGPRKTSRAKASIAVAVLPHRLRSVLQADDPASSVGRFQAHSYCAR
jgi:hypothetical protein